MFPNNKRFAFALFSKLSLAFIAGAVPSPYRRRHCSLRRLADLYATDTVQARLWSLQQDGTATTFASGLTDPQGIALSQDANVYVCEGTVGDLLKFTPDGTMTVLQSGFSNPIGLAFDGTGYPGGREWR